MAKDYADSMMDVINDIKESGASTLRGIGSELNQRGFRTRRNKSWSAAAVMRVVQASI